MRENLLDRRQFCSFKKATLRELRPQRLVNEAIAASKDQGRTRTQEHQVALPSIID